MVSGIKNILETIELNRCPYWNIRKGLKDPVMFTDDAKEHQELTLSESLQRLEYILRMLQPGRYILEYYDTADARNNRKKIDFLIEGNQQISGVPAQYQQPEDINVKIQKAVENERLKWETQEKIKELERQINEITQQKLTIEKELRAAKAEAESTTNRILNKLEPYAPAILGAFFPKIQPAAVAGTTKIEFEQKDEITEKLENALSQWAETETVEDIIRLIEKIAILAKENKQMYNVAKGFLK